MNALFPLLVALAAPLLAWLAQRGQLFGPAIDTLAERHASLLLASGYAFSIWGLIFVLDLLAAWRLLPRRRAALAPDSLRRLLPPLSLGWAASVAWMPLFSAQRFGLALLALVLALAALLLALALLEDVPRPPWPLRTALRLHVGWLALALPMHLALMGVAGGWWPAERQLPAGLLLWGASALWLLGLNQLLRAPPALVLALLWGLLGVQHRQARSGLDGAEVSAGIALALAAVLLLQSLYHGWRAWRARGRRRGGQITLVNLR